MPLSSIGPALERALKGHYAIPLFDVFDTHSIEGVFATSTSSGKSTRGRACAAPHHTAPPPACRAPVTTKTGKTPAGSSRRTRIDRGLGVPRCLMMASSIVMGIRPQRGTAKPAGSAATTVDPGASDPPADRWPASKPGRW